MKLAQRLFISYLLIIGVGLAALAVTTSLLAPVNFSDQIMHMGQSGRGMSGMQQGGMSQQMESLDDEIERSFRSAVNQALLVAGIAVTAAAVIVSWLVSQRIVRPVRALAVASREIADGKYDRRIDVQGDDELGELTQSFNRMAQTLAQTETMRRELLADVAHELKTPLATITGYMEGLQDNIVAPTAETFQLIHREASRLQRLVEDLQELSRAEAGQVSIHAETLDLAALVGGVSERLRPQFTEKELELTLVSIDDVVMAVVDRDRTEQVLVNLLGNALQYTPSGGQITVRLTHDLQSARIAIQDNGIGLSQEDTRHIFQRFYRVEKSRSRSGGGSGIGLTIARYFVEAQHGRIWAESQGPGQGSTFYVTLPIAPNFTKTSH
ncbi:MAG: HAMP domain-containing histidine kinase [Anaerolineae bacterium]|nr:HAMP domain-containing histidine kinase [Anaerolineae bacterium]